MNFRSNPEDSDAIDLNVWKEPIKRLSGAKTRGRLGYSERKEKRNLEATDFGLPGLKSDRMPGSASHGEPAAELEFS
jgi:hypothetical protein